MGDAMANTHFIARAHTCLMNKFLNTIVGLLECFLHWQRLNVLDLVAQDEHLQ